MAPSAPQTPNSPFPSPNTVQPSSLSRLTLSDKLLLSQAVHHIGTSPPDWGRVSSILLPHPLIKTKSRLEQAAKAGITLGRVFGSRECERAWVALMRQYNLVLQPGERDVALESENEAGSPAVGNRAKEARGLPPKTDRGSQLALAQFLYAERVREIQEQIKAKEKAFKTLAGEIEALNAGTLDEKLLDELEKSGLLREESDKESGEKDAINSQTGDESDDLTPSASQSSTSKRELSSTPKKSNSTKTSPKVTRDQKSSSIGATSSSKSPLAEKDKGEKGKAANSIKQSKDSKAGLPTSKTITKDAKSSEVNSVPIAAKPSTNQEGVPEKPKDDVSLSDSNEKEDVENAALEKGGDAMDVDTAGEPSTNSTSVGKESEKDNDESNNSNAKRKRDATPSDGDRGEVGVAVVQKKAREEDISKTSEPSTNVSNTEKVGDGVRTGKSELQDDVAEQVSAESKDVARAEQLTKSAQEISKRYHDARASEESEAINEAEYSAQKSGNAESILAGDRDLKADSNVVEDRMEIDEEGEDEIKQGDDQEDEDDNEEPGEQKRPEPRRSRRSGRNISVTTDDVPTPPPSATPATVPSAKNSRVEALRSREASGTSPDTDEERAGEDTGDADASRSTIDRSRTSLSPVATRRGRGASRQSRKSGGRAPSAGVGGGLADEAGTSAGSDAERERAAQVIEKRKMEKVLMMLLNEVSNHTHGNLFHNPIKESDAPDYYTLIRHPLDLKTIKARIKEGRITSATQLRRSLMQMFANSLIYNRPGSEIHRMALEMRDAAEDMLDRFEQTQMSAKASRR